MKIFFLYFKRCLYVIETPFYFSWLLITFSRWKFRLCCRRKCVNYIFQKAVIQRRERLGWPPLSFSSFLFVCLVFVVFLSLFCFLFFFNHYLLLQFLTISWTPKFILAPTLKKNPSFNPVCGVNKRKGSQNIVFPKSSIDIFNLWKLSHFKSEYKLRGQL